jgi:hypothetical protein
MRNPILGFFYIKANASERAMVAGLGGLNLFGVIILGNLLKDCNSSFQVSFSCIEISPTKLVVIMKANDNDAWWAYLICCTTISIASGISELYPSVLFFIYKWIGTNHYITHFHQHTYRGLVILIDVQPFHKV